MGCTGGGGGLHQGIAPPPLCPTNNFVLKTYGPNGSARWTRRLVRGNIVKQREHPWAQNTAHSMDN